MRAWYWQQEFPLVKHQQSTDEWWDESYNPGAKGMPAPPEKPRRLRPVSLDRVWE